MKKIVSFFIFLAAFIWTWNLVHSASPAIGYEVHAGLQEKFASLIEQTLMQKKPQAQDFEIIRLWTETLDNNKIRAVFSYKYTEPNENGSSTERTVEGEASLHREPSENNQTEKWSLQNVKTTNDSLTFTEGMVISPNDNSSSESPAESEPSVDAEKKKSPAPQEPSK